MPSSHKLPENTDLSAPNIKLYIEGVSIPFIAISITQSSDDLPRASIQVPVFTGLTDLARYYSPKVHVFYYDEFYEKDVVLFTGVIAATTYLKAAGEPPSTYISFDCIHKNSQLVDLTMRFVGYEQASLNDNPTDAPYALPVLGSTQSYTMAYTSIKANAGGAITEGNPEGDASALPPGMESYYGRLQGIPGVLVNLWNQMKAACFRNSEISEAMTWLYIPLIEQGLHYFQRMSGHPYLESQIEARRQDPCPKESPEYPGKVVIPPAMYTFANNAVSSSFVKESMVSGMSGANEMTSFLSYLKRFCDIIQYDMVTLASPAEPKTGKDAVETLLKPSLPFYYAPMCNLFLPHMFHSLSVSEDNFGTPSRIIIADDMAMGDGVSGGSNPLFFRGPPSVRKAIAGAGSLVDTFQSSKDRVGKYEQARGIKPEAAMLPKWMSLFAATTGNSEVNTFGSEYPFNTSALNNLRAGWEARNYGGTKMNPWDNVASGVTSVQAILTDAADYEYSMAVVRKRTGQLEGPFNPYVIPGYPMDILDETEYHPSYHAYCTSVTHSITNSSITTTVSFLGAMTYSEISNYYMPPVTAWLREVLGFSYDENLVENEEAAPIAHAFYSGALGIGAVLPDEVFDFEKNTVKPLKRRMSNLGFDESTKDSRVVDGFESNPNLTTIGNMYLVRREIESKEDVEARCGVTFVDVNDIDPTKAPSLINFKAGNPNNVASLLEVGQNEFLSYTEVQHKK